MWFVRQRKVLLIIGAVITLAALAIIVRFGIPLGIDFTGGALTEVVFMEQPGVSEVTAELDVLGLGAYSVRETVDGEGRAGYIVRTRDLAEDERTAVDAALMRVGIEPEIVRFTSIGPVIGEELKSKSAWAIAGVSLVIVLYVAYAFAGVAYPVGSWVYGGITILALLHDVIIPAAVMTLLGVMVGVEADVLFIMALLAILGYSVNDTIVVFDRVRENLTKFRQEKKTKVISVDGIEREEISYVLTKPFSKIVGQSIDETIVRSINTSLTTFLALAALYVFGGDSTQTFALVLMAGVVAGTYSSICIANPLLVVAAERLHKEVI